MTAVEFRQSIERLGKVSACRALDATIQSEDQANLYIWDYVSRLLAVDEYVGAAIVLWGDRLANPRPKAVRDVWKLIQESSKCLLQGGASVGKCLGAGVEVLMYNGERKRVEDVKIGDLLMGDDSSPRRVLTTFSGEDQLYRIVPVRGDPWVCNSGHVLSLKCAIGKKNGDGKTISSNYTKGSVVDVRIGDYLQASKTFKDFYKQYRVGVEFPEQELEIDPYMYGMWLGDGGVDNPVLHNADPVLIKAWCEYFTSIGYRIVVAGENSGPCRAYYVRKTKGKYHPFKAFLRKSCDQNGKRIRQEYLVNSKENRMQLLAGLIDTDGWSQKMMYCITTKWKGLAQDIAFLANSLGFTGTVKTTRKKIKKLNFIGTYYTVTISGRDLDMLPTKLKQCEIKGSTRDPQLTSFEVEDAGRGKFYGFTIDGNQRFLLGDCTVTHNSYSVIVWLALDYIRDPKYTTVKIISATKKHASSNTFSTLVRLFREAIIPLPGEVFSDYIGLDSKDRRSGIEIIAIPEGQDGGGKLQGFHPEPRPFLHPSLGPSARIRVFLDEAEEIPGGVWQGVNNTLASVHGAQTIKVICAYNPKDASSKVAMMAQPVGGWSQFDLERGVKGSDVWESKEGWTVFRIDPKKTENVQQRRQVYEGFQTYEAFRRYETLNGGNAPDAYTFGRGSYPPNSSVNIIIPGEIFERCRGEFIWSRGTTKCGASDIAVDGRDRATFASGQCGLAVGFKSHASKEIIRFKNPRLALQVDQIFEITKGDTKIVGDSIKTQCKSLGIPGEWLGVDSTGNGGAVWSYLRAAFHDEVTGIDFSKPATEIKILEEHKTTPHEKYKGLVTEVWFALRDWMEFGFIAIAPGVRTDPLESELRARRYMLSAGELLKVEKKDDYKARMGNSPDFADVVTILLQTVRQRLSLTGSMQDLPKEETRTMELRHGVVDAVEWMPEGLN